LGRGLPEFHSGPFYALQAGRESRKALVPRFAQAETDRNWYERLYIVGDDHFSAEGHALVAREVEKHLR